MCVVVHFCHFLQKNRRQQSRKKKRKEDGDKQGAANISEGLPKSGVCWILRSEGGESVTASTQQFLQKRLENFPFDLTRSQKRRRDKLSPHLNVWTDSNMKKRPKKKSICCFLSVLHASARLKNNQTKEQIGTSSRKAHQKKAKVALKERETLLEVPVPVPSRA